ncbi:MAG: hypothetical protein QM644_08555, partial [Mobilitalea sp.]
LTVPFTAATAKLTDIAKIVLDDVKVKTTDTTGVELLDYVKALNADGVVIYSGSEISSYLTFTYGGEAGKGFVSGTKLYLYGEGTSAKITASFSNWFVNASNVYTEFKTSDDAVAIVYKEDANLNTGSISYVLNTTYTTTGSATTGWASSFNLPKGDSGLFISARYQNNNSATGTYNYTDNTSMFTYTSNDPAKVLVTGNQITALNEGSVDIVVKTAADGKVVGVFTVNVGPARALASVEADVYTVSMGNATAADVKESKAVKLSVKDTSGRLYNDAVVTGQIISAPTGSTLTYGTAGLVTLTPNADGTISLTFDGSVFVLPGAYTFKVEASKLGASKPVIVTVNVLDASSTTVQRYIPTLSTTSVDLKTITGTTTVVPEIYGYNAAGARVVKLVADTDFTYTVSTTAGVAQSGAHIDPATGIDVATLAANVFTTNVAIGNYRVDFKAKIAVTNKAAVTPVTLYPALADMGSAIFEVKDSAVLSVADVKTAVAHTAGITVKQVAAAALTLTIDGVAVDQVLDTSKISITGKVGAGAATGITTPAKGESVYIETITYTGAAAGGTGNTRTVTFTVNRLVTLN